MTLEDLKLFTLYSDGYTSLHSLALKCELAEGTDLTTPDGLPHLNLRPFEVAIHRWAGAAGTDAEIENLGCPAMEDVYGYVEAHPDCFTRLPIDYEEEGDDEDEDDEDDDYPECNDCGSLNTEYDRRCANGTVYRCRDCGEETLV